MPANFEVVPVHCSTANAALLEKVCSAVFTLLFGTKILKFYSGQNFIFSQARSVLKAAEQYSGATPTEHLSTPQHFAVLLLDVTRKSEKRIIGCVAAESVKRGQLDHVSIPDRDLPNDAIMDHELFYGIYVLWIAPTYRRKGFAVSLLDILRYVRMWWLVPSIDWLIDWTVHSSFEWLIDWLDCSLIVWLIDWLTISSLVP